MKSNRWGCNMNFVIVVVLTCNEGNVVVEDEHHGVGAGSHSGQDAAGRIGRDLHGECEQVF